MSRSSEPVKELLVDPRVNVSYIGSENDVYISVAGSARMVDDMPSKERFWSSMVEAWFPQGITDPDLVLVCVEIDSAEYWNMTDGKLTQLAKMAKAVWKGEPPTDMAEHGTIG
jgi:general stress protein 26